MELQLGLERSAAEVASLDTRLLQLEQGGGGDTLARVQPLQEAALPDLSVDTHNQQQTILLTYLTTSAPQPESAAGPVPHGGAAAAGGAGQDRVPAADEGGPGAGAGAAGRGVLSLHSQGGQGVTGGQPGVWCSASKSCIRIASEGS